MADEKLLFRTHPAPRPKKEPKKRTEPVDFVCEIEGSVEPERVNGMKWDTFKFLEDEKRSNRKEIHRLMDTAPMGYEKHG